MFYKTSLLALTLSTAAAPALWANAAPSHNRPSEDGQHEQHQDARKIVHQLNTWSQLEGIDIQDKQGNVVATLENLVVNTKSGKIELVIIRHDKGLTDVGGTLYAVPYNTLSVMEHDGEWLAQTKHSAKAIEAMHAFDAKKVKGLYVTTWYEELGESVEATEENDRGYSKYFITDLNGRDLVHPHNNADDNVQSVASVDDLVIETKLGQLGLLSVEPTNDKITDKRLVPWQVVEDIKQDELEVEFKESTLDKAIVSPANGNYTLVARDLESVYDAFGIDMPYEGPRNRPDVPGRQVSVAQ